MAARQATCVAIGGRALLIEGPIGSGKSSLALALIDRGAMLVGDDGVMLRARAGTLIACPHPNTRGLLETRNLGLLQFPVREEAPVALVLRLDEAAPRYVDKNQVMRSGGHCPADAAAPTGQPGPGDQGGACARSLRACHSPARGQAGLSASLWRGMGAKQPFHA